MLSQVREIVKKACLECKRYSRNTWEYHILRVAKYSRLLAKKLKADQELAELAALLHDIGSIKFGEENHEITGQVEAEKILKSLGFSPKIIAEVKECIRSHRGSKDIKPRTLIAKIVSNADAIAHFDTIPILLRVGLKQEGGDEEKAAKWVLEKLERDWKKKLTIPEAKKLTRSKYQAAKLLLKMD
jgi:uncharacterized protein